MRVSVVILTFAALASKVYAQMEVQNCHPNPAFKMTNVNWAPSPACIGKQFCAVGTGNLTQPIIQGAKFQLNAKYLGRIVYVENQDFCAMLAAQGTPCPVPAGPTVLKGCITIKSSTPEKVSTNQSSTQKILSTTNWRDMLHAILAHKASAEYLVTRNVYDFTGTEHLLKTVFPEQIG